MTHYDFAGFSTEALTGLAFDLVGENRAEDEPAVSLIFERLGDLLTTEEYVDLMRDLAAHTVNVAVARTRREIALGSSRAAKWRLLATAMRQKQAPRADQAAELAARFRAQTDELQRRLAIYLASVPLSARKTD